MHEVWHWLNLKTGRVSPQFHVVMDPSYNTVNGRDGNDPPPAYWQAQCGFTKGKRVLPAEETHSAEPEFVSLSDKGQEIEDKDNDQESEAQILQRRKPTRNQRMIEDRKHQKGVQRQIQRTLQGRKQQTQEAQGPPAPRGEAKHTSKSRKIEIDREQMDQQL
jgi:hypothetical protein